MGDTYMMPGLLSDEELGFARKALRLPPGDTPLTTDQYKDWVLIRDTWLENWLTRPGSAAEQQREVKEPVVVTKKVISMSKYRR